MCDLCLSLSVLLSVCVCVGVLVCVLWRLGLLFHSILCARFLLAGLLLFLAALVKEDLPKCLSKAGVESGRRWWEKKENRGERKGGKRVA